MIEVGQRYKKTDPPSAVWQVLEMVMKPGCIRHFRIVNLSDPTTIKLISEPTLANDRLYRLINER